MTREHHDFQTLGRETFERYRQGTVIPYPDAPHGFPGMWVTVRFRNKKTGKTVRRREYRKDRSTRALAYACERLQLSRELALQLHDPSPPADVFLWPEYVVREGEIPGESEYLGVKRGIRRRVRRHARKNLPGLRSRRRR